MSLIAFGPGSWADADPFSNVGLLLAVLCGAALVALIPVGYFLLRPYRARPLEQIVPDSQVQPLVVLLPPVSAEPPTTYPSAPPMMHAKPWYQQRAVTLESAQHPPPPSAPPQSLAAPPASLKVTTPLGIGPKTEVLPVQPPPRIPPRQPSNAIVDARELPDFDDKPTTLLDRSAAAPLPVEPPPPRPHDTVRDVSDLAFDPTVTAAPDELPPGRAPSPPRVKMASRPPPSGPPASSPLPPPTPPPRRPSAPRIRMTQPAAPRTPPPPKPPSVWGRVDPNETAALTPVTAPPVSTRPRPRS
jgi:hypothetical protein